MDPNPILIGEPPDPDDEAAMNAQADQVIAAWENEGAVSEATED